MHQATSISIIVRKQLLPSLEKPARESNLWKGQNKLLFIFINSNFHSGSFLLLMISFIFSDENLKGWLLYFEARKRGCQVTKKTLLTQALDIWIITQS